MQHHQECVKILISSNVGIPSLFHVEQLAETHIASIYFSELHSLNYLK